MDFSTINTELLKQLPTFRLPGATTDDVTDVHTGRFHWTLQEHSGNGCYLDAPGYPTYFTRSVYRNGDSPPHGPVMVITYNGKHRVIAMHDDSWEETERLLRRLWMPLPLEHKRVQQWLRELHRHQKNCYVDDKLELGNSDRTFIFPVPKYKLKRFEDDERFTDAWRDKAKAEVEEYNAEVIARASTLATPENHLATRSARRFYPSYAPNTDLINHPPIEPEGDWWETEAEQPTPQTCVPRGGIGHETHEGDGWCQWCGWRGTEAA